MVRTLGFDSSNPGSNPGETYSPLAQLAERSTVNRKVAGSNPARRVMSPYYGSELSLHHSIDGSISIIISDY